MNIKMIYYILGLIMYLEAAFLTLPLLVGVLYQEEATASFLVTIAICILLGFFLAFKKPEKSRIFAKEGFVIVALSWIVLSVLGALPFMLSGTIPSFIDAFFETVSGFTTTGASILPQVENLPRSILFWRSFTHWLGGMGVLVFILAILPDGGRHTIHLLRAESPGPSVEKILPKLRATAKMLYVIYFALTLTQIVLLLAGGMPVFDSVVNSLATAGTGGFAIKNTSIAAYNSYYLQGVITVFMILFGVNFSFYTLLIAGRWREALRYEEVRWYFGIMLTAILVITWNILPMFDTGLISFHHASFQVASVMTTTGFATVDFNRWPELSRFIMLLVMFVGACGGSTGGGLKISRVVIMLKSLKAELQHMLHPRSIRVVRMNTKVVDKDVIHGTQIYFIVYMLIFAVSVLLVSFDNLDMTTTVTGVIACLNNIGPGLELVGATGNYSVFSSFAKLVLAANMLFGRLEIFPMLLLFFPSVWTKERVLRKHVAEQYSGDDV